MKKGMNFKKIALMGACLSSVALVSACSSSTAPVADSYTDTDVSKDQKPALEESKSSVSPIAVGEKMIFDNRVEMTITNVAFKNDVQPSKPGDFHSHYEDESAENTYLDIKGTLKNIQTEDLDLAFEDPVDIEVFYQGKYKYDGFTAIEEADGSDFEMVAFVEPLTSRTFHYLVTVPNEVEQSADSLVANIKYGEKEFQLKIR